MLVTGATGFLGHHVVQAFVDAGYEVRALCRDPDARAARRLPAACERMRGDVLDAELVGSAALGCEGVIHCAGWVSRRPVDAHELHRVNVDGTRVTLAAARTAKVRRFVLASTSGTIAISTDADAIADETTPTPLELINRWPYYRSKYYAEKLALEAASDHFEVVVVNPSLLLGPGDLHGSSTTDVRRFLENGMPVVPAGGMSFVDARDAARGILLAYERGASKQRYLLTASNCTLRTFFSRVARVAGVSAPVAGLPNSPLLKRLTKWAIERATDIMGEDDAAVDGHSVDVAQHYWYCNAGKAERELGWRARDPMVTLADTVEDLRERGIVMMKSPNATSAAR